MDRRLRRMRGSEGGTVNEAKLKDMRDSSFTPIIVRDLIDAILGEPSERGSEGAECPLCTSVDKRIKFGIKKGSETVVCEHSWHFEAPLASCPKCGSESKELKLCMGCYGDLRPGKHCVIECNHSWHSKPSSPASAKAPAPSTFSVEIYQHDWIPGFAAFHNDHSINESAKAHVVLNLGSMLAAVKEGDLKSQDLPYLIAESLMHEVIHTLEAWANVEFSEDRVEGLLEKYREKYERDTIWEYTGKEPEKVEPAQPKGTCAPVRNPHTAAECYYYDGTLGTHNRATWQPLRPESAKPESVREEPPTPTITGREYKTTDTQVMVGAAVPVSEGVTLRELSKALFTYGKHKRPCLAQGAFGANPCICGLRDLLQSLSSGPKESAK